MGGLGAGLSTVGGNTAGGAFARGMGGGITGAMKTNDAQQSQLMKQRAQFFNETIASDNQDMKHKLFPLNVQHLMAATNRLNGQASGMTGQGAWQVSDVGRMHLAQTEHNAWEGREIQRLSAMRAAGIDTTDEANNFKARSDADLKQRYDMYRVDPDKAQGTQKNPIDGTKMSLQDMHTMPAGTYFSYKDADGKTQTTTRKADEFNTPALRQQPQPSDYAADQAALGAGGTSLGDNNMVPIPE